VFRGLVPTIGLLAAVVPIPAQAQQTNLDQGKSASQIFAGSCVECHKAAHGLAKGKSAGAVAEFLLEHYTTSRDQAAALAAYVVGGRDTVAAPTPGKKPPAEHATAATEEAKPSKPQKPAKPEEKPSSTVRLQRPRDADVKPKEEENSVVPNIRNPIVRPEGYEERPGARNRRKEPKPPETPQEPAAVAHEPAAVVVDPARSEPATREPSTNTTPAADAPAAAGASGDAGESGPASRDNVPD
jgi:mono/diheme cytochrome c family protein